MSEKPLPVRVVDAMMAKDYFSQWLGIERLEDGEGISVIRMTVRNEMLNGFGIAHGGITYSLADSAFAFASNSHGRHAVSIETSISHTQAVFEGDVLTASAKLDKLSNRVAWYRVEITNQNQDLVAIFKGTVYRKSQEWEND
ncbi:MAG: hydroxyphenylacetyl-CoA thioesterase PaaI [Saprospiraceae bacterium]|nr:hydroxyphenylacetyl-CoA thioesterase PaaI [Saprospiraceae bacterium]